MAFQRSQWDCLFSNHANPVALYFRITEIFQLFYLHVTQFHQTCSIPRLHLIVHVVTRNNKGMMVNLTQPSWMTKSFTDWLYLSLQSCGFSEQKHVRCRIVKSGNPCQTAHPLITSKVIEKLN